jgi:hypothetical protein
VAFIATTTSQEDAMSKTLRADKTDPSERHFPYVPGAPFVTAADINRSDVRMRLAERFPDFAAALDAAVDTLALDRMAWDAFADATVSHDRSRASAMGLTLASR